MLKLTRWDAMVAFGGLLALFGYAMLHYTDFQVASAWLPIVAGIVIAIIGAAGGLIDAAGRLDAPCNLPEGSDDG